MLDAWTVSIYMHKILVMLTKQQRTMRQTSPVTLRPTESKYSFIISLTT